MGIIACSRPGTAVNAVIPRRNIQSRDVASFGQISLKYFKVPDHEVSPIHFMKLSTGDNSSDQFIKLDLFSKVIWPLRPSRPSWSGFMKLHQRQEDYPGKASITFMPMIDMNPGDMSCINSTLHFICEQSKRYDVTPVITFDQPLFWKAMTILNSVKESSPLRRIVLRLGAFHTEMSFLGSICHLMMGSGLQELLETVYAANAVTHMLTGKALARAVRGHFLVDTALHTILFSKMYNIKLSEPSHGAPNADKDTEDILPVSDVPTDNIKVYSDKLETLNINQSALCEEGEASRIFSAVSVPSDGNSSTLGIKENVEIGNEIIQEDIDNNIINESVKLYDKLTDDKISIQEIFSSVQLEALKEDFAQEKEKHHCNRTAALWLQYMEMVSVLQQFIRAERTGDWQGHLSAIKKMLPYFAASGHNLYLESAYMYLQNMFQLKTDHPAIHKAFTDGKHAVRRSDRFWAGLSTDLVIEQVLMRSVKSTGGMTRGRGMSELQRTLWLLSMPACAEMNISMQQFSGIDYKTSEQDKEVGKTRAARDEKDTYTFLSHLQQRNPFQTDIEYDNVLRNIETGVTADSVVNVDNANEIGTKILDEMIGKSVSDYSFKKSQQAVTMNEKTSIKVSGEVISVDPQLLFQRLTTAANRHVSDISEIFKYELCGIPSSPFDNSGLLREPHKSALAQAIWSIGDCEMDKAYSPNDTTQFVLDGGSLVQHIPWEKGSTFADICNRYYEYTKQKYTNAVVDFDGYDSGPSTKDMTHLRRTKGNIGTKVKFGFDTPFKTKKETFLSNTQNKQKFLYLLGEHLTKNDITVKHASADADLLIVTTAVELAYITDTIIIGEDTDLLVLLLYYVSPESHKLHVRSDARHTSSLKRKVWDVQKTMALLGDEVSRLLPLAHTLTGCDTTSRIFGISKPAVLKALLKNNIFRCLLTTFLNAKSKAEVIKAGEDLVIHLFGGLTFEGIDLLRFRKFATKVMASSSCVQVHTLPPTSAAAAYHSQRVHLQVQTWIGNNSLVPEDWGWELEKDNLMPVKTDLPPAPEKLLQIIRCNCKQNCDTKRCSCRKHGLDCSVGCGECRGVSCSNSINIADIDFEEET